MKHNKGFKLVIESVIDKDTFKREDLFEPKQCPVQHLHTEVDKEEDIDAVEITSNLKFKVNFKSEWLDAYDTAKIIGELETFKHFLKNHLWGECIYNKEIGEIINIR